MGEERSAVMATVGNPEGQRPLEESMHINL
jgi:hypothetical protein